MTLIDGDIAASHDSVLEQTKPVHRRAAVFIDRDGTINEDIGYLSHPDDLHIYSFAAEAIRLLNDANLPIIVITNQSGIARGFLDELMLARIHERLLNKLAQQGAHVDGIYYCPHHPRIFPNESYVIGDKSSDINLATNAGAKGILVLTGYGASTYANLERFPCYPSMVAEDLLEAVRLILTERQQQSRD